MFRTILVPTDFSEASLRAYDVALDLARRFSSRLVLFHCYAVNPGGISPYGIVLPEGADRGLRDVADRALVAWSEKGAAGGVRVETRLGTDAPVMGIVQCIDDVGADLVVMATHARKGLARMALGSVTATTLRIASVPVLTVGPEDELEDPGHE